MRYEVRVQATGKVKEPCQDLAYAIHIARSMCKWNKPCDVIDMETGEVMFSGEAYSVNA